MLKIEDIKTVLVIGAGTMGAQISLQCAVHGLSVNLYDISQEALDKGMLMIREFSHSMTAMNLLTEADAGTALSRIHPTTDANTAAQADLVSESVPEDPQLKSKVFAQFNQLCPPLTIFTTNTSTLVPSMIAEATGRPGQFAALHFHTYVWISNVVDVMPHPGTSSETMDLLEQFARRIGQIPIRLSVENYGYVFNSMLNSLLRSASSLAARQITTHQNVDRAWMGVMKTPIGPFGIMDQVGLDTVWEINQYWADRLKDNELQAIANLMKTYVDKGCLGVKSGQGFYHYPDPEFQKPTFIKG